MQIGNMTQKIRKTALDRCRIRCRQLVLCASAVHLERANRRNEHDRRRCQLAKAAFDIQKFLRTEIGAEARFRDDIIRQVKRRLRREHRIASVRDIRKRSAMYESRYVLQRLHQIRFQCVFHERRHRARRVQIARRDRFIFIRIRDDDPRQPRLEIRDVLCQAQNRHDFRRHRNLETVLARHAVHRPAEPDDDMTKRAVIHIQHATPDDTTRIDTERVSLLQMIVQHRREKIVRRRHRMDIPREMQIDILHRDDLRISAAGRAALHAHARPQRRLAKTNHHLFPDLGKSLRQSHRRRRLPFTRRCRRNRRHQDQFPDRRTLDPLRQPQRHLGLVRPIRLQLLLRNSDRRRNLPDGLHLRPLRNLNVRQHSILLFPQKIPFALTKLFIIIA